MRSGRFVLLATQRSGSTWIAELLNNAAPDVATYGELFLEQRRTWDVGPEDVLRFTEHPASETRWSRPLGTFRYLRELYDRPGTVGFKLMYSQLQAFPEAWAYIATGVKVVHLVRSNVLDTLISTYMTQARGAYHSHEAAAVAQASSIVLKPETIVAELDRIDSKISYVRKLVACSPCPSLEINYETVRADPDSTIDEVASFIGTEVHSGVTSTLRKLRTSNKRATIENYTEIASELAGSKYERLLADEHE